MEEGREKRETEQKVQQKGKGKGLDFIVEATVTNIGKNIVSAIFF